MRVLIVALLAAISYAQTGGPNCPDRCLTCRSGGRSGSALVDGMCQEWCSLFSYCGTDPVYQYTDCSQCSKQTTASPTIDPTDAPTADPTSKEPTAEPSLSPTVDPTSKEPTVEPTLAPTDEPTSGEPTKEPTMDPTMTPSAGPTKEPTVPPTFANALMECMDERGTGWSCPDSVTAEPSFSDGCYMWTRETSNVDWSKYAYEFIYADSRYGHVKCLWPFKDAGEDTSVNFLDVTDPTDMTGTLSLSGNTCTVLSGGGAPAALDLTDNGGAFTSMTARYFMSTSGCTENTKVTTQEVYDNGGMTVNEVRNHFLTFTHADYLAVIAFWQTPLTLPEDMNRIKKILNENEGRIQGSGSKAARFKGIHNRMNTMYKPVKNGATNPVLADGHPMFCKHIWRRLREIEKFSYKSPGNFDRPSWFEFVRKFENLEKCYSEKVLNIDLPDWPANEQN